MNSRKPYKQLEHTGDLRLQIVGKSLPDLLKNAVYALTDQMMDATNVHAKRGQRIKIATTTPDLLLFELLKECLFRFDARRFASAGLQKIKITPEGFEANLMGETISPRHERRTEIKAVTLHGLKVENKRGRWVAEVVFDL